MKSRSDRFRERYLVGQVLCGRVSGLIGPGLAWVEIEGLELTARLEREAGLGEELNFRVAALYPEIVLKQVGESERPKLDVRI